MAAVVWAAQRTPGILSMLYPLTDCVTGLLSERRGGIGASSQLGAPPLFFHVACAGSSLPCNGASSSFQPQRADEPCSRLLHTGTE